MLGFLVCSRSAEQALAVFVTAGGGFLFCGVFFESDGMVLGVFLGDGRVFKGSSWNPFSPYGESAFFFLFEMFPPGSLYPLSFFFRSFRLRFDGG